ncbi:PepSY-associated TM helix domain-containing protein [Mucilaginibacter terrae]|uniref:Iron-regulated membrane protein n=1 Tax=Mucilaginibacter terrae TaxID=1955052 RepID=A0ABU3GNI0_9SPHI|nr:PepSY-associated TM helix domain-containing protein [Mucilaginibacter terrae]MDT3401338.1 putative iron-regulated membrane protein [Mucilaginibacter terrae]
MEIKTAKKKSIFRKVSEWLHLWLGLISGIIVFVVCLTGGLWVFRYEVFYFTEKYQRLEEKQRAFLQPSVLEKQGKNYLNAHKDTGSVLMNITYGKGKSAILTFHLPAEKFAMLYLDPYTGHVVFDKREPSPAEMFFIVVRAGHRFLWLPQKIGSPIVGSGCIIFLVILTTGLIWWWPKRWTKKTRDKSFKVKWDAKWKRLNIDLHNVLGFYSLLFVLLLTVTGITFSFHWFADGLYKTLTWQTHERLGEGGPHSDTLLAVKSVLHNKNDLVWQDMQQKHPDYSRVMINMPENTKGAYHATAFFGDGTLIYNRAQYYYDQFSLKRIYLNTQDERSYDELSFGEKVYRMDFDIHTGQILGLPTKILAFIACIIGASLPVTGTIIWYNRKWGKKKPIKENRQTQSNIV